MLSRYNCQTGMSLLFFTMRQRELVPSRIHLIPIYRDREIGYMVGMAESKMIVIPDEFRGFDYPAMIDTIVPPMAIT